MKGKKLVFIQLLVTSENIRNNLQALEIRYPTKYTKKARRKKGQRNHYDKEQV